jgi:hypothetical protein
MKKVVTVIAGFVEAGLQPSRPISWAALPGPRLGADDDTTKAWELMRRHQATADAVGLGEIGDHYQVGLRTVVNKETQRLLNVVTRVPATTGATLRRLLQVRAVRHVQHELGHYFNNNIVLFLNGMRNYDMAVALSDYTSNLNFADALFQTGAPTMLGSLEQLELFAKGSDLVLAGRPRELLESALAGFKSSRVAAAVAKSHVVVGTFAEIKAVGGPANLSGKTVITSAVDDERQAWFKTCGVNLVIDVSPKLFDRVVGVNVVEAMILAALGKPPEEVSDDDFTEILDELKITPRLLHPTGRFRNIRRFAFVIHPLSQEFIKKGFPIPKATPKFVMDKVETLAAHMPPMVYCKMENIVSPTGAEAEGWLITVGGTPKEMLARSPEFTYRRLLHASRIAEKLGAQIMGLGRLHQGGGRRRRHGGAAIATAHHHRQQLLGQRGAVGRGRRDEAHGSGAAGAKGRQRIQAKTMVIGASGSIGSVSAGCWRWPSKRW